MWRRGCREVVRHRYLRASLFLSAAKPLGILPKYNCPRDGRFQFMGLPAESISLYVRIKGYKLFHKNPSLDWHNESIVGRIEKDLTNFTILLEPGKWRLNEEAENAPPGTLLQPTGTPLRSANATHE